jgi:hypothetical protein
MVTVEDLSGLSGGTGSDAEGDGDERAGRQLGRIICLTDEGRVTLWTDLVALDGCSIEIVSLMGAESAAKAVAAVLHSEGQARFRIEAEGVPHYQEFGKDRQGYAVYKHRVSLNHWHFLCISKRPGLLTSRDEASLWRELRSERFTTPLLRCWAPYIVEQLKERHLLERLDGFGCEAGLLTADSDDLDEIVAEGLRNRQIVIE